MKKKNRNTSNCQSESMRGILQRTFETTRVSANGARGTIEINRHWWQDLSWNNRRRDRGEQERGVIHREAGKSEVPVSRAQPQPTHKERGAGGVHDSDNATS